jgi:hypothetical protein
MGAAGSVRVNHQLPGQDIHLLDIEHLFTARSAKSSRDPSRSIASSSGWGGTHSETGRRLSSSPPARESIVS